MIPRLVGSFPLLPFSVTFLGCGNKAQQVNWDERDDDSDDAVTIPSLAYFACYLFCYNITARVFVALRLLVLKRSSIKVNICVLSTFS